MILLTIIKGYLLKYRKFVFLSKKLNFLFNKIVTWNIKANYYNLNIMVVYIHHILYKHLRRNKFIYFITYWWFIHYSYTLNSIAILKNFYQFIVIKNLFVELLACYLILFRWNNIGIMFKGLYVSVYHFFKQLLFNYHKYSNRPLKIDWIYINLEEFYGYKTYKRYPRIRRRVRV